MSKVIIYSKDICQPCNLMKLWLKEHDVEYEERNINTEEAYMQELKDMGYQSVPIVLVDGEVVANGFEPWKLEGLV